MIKLTRRTLLVGTSALMAAGTVSFRALAASRTYHALLVACTEYPNLPQRNWLIGPKNDAGLVHEYLLKNVPDPVRFAPENVTLLAKDVPGAKGLPTHAAIKAALADLAAKVQRDDFVYLHLSGHGAQQPEMIKGDETDGLDEIFLPVDIDKWINRDAGVPNALVDNEIGDALDAIRNKGAFVWVVFDCCHSGTATRAVEVDDELERKVEFADLVGGDEAARAAAVKAYEDTVASASRGLDENGAAQARLQPDADRRRTDHQGQAGRLLCRADGGDDAGNAVAQGHDGRAALRPVHLHHPVEARRKPQRHLSPAWPGRAAAIFGRQPHPADAAVRGRTRRARLRHRQDRRGHAVAHRRQGRRGDDRRRPAASPHPRQQARHPALGAVVAVRRGRLSRSAVGQEPGKPRQAGRVRQETRR